MTERNSPTLLTHARVSEGLSELKTALRRLTVPPPDVEELRRTFRAVRKEQVRSFEAPTRSRRAPVYASAAALVVSIATAMWVAFDRFGAREEPQNALVPMARSGTPLPAGAFQPLMYAPGVSPNDSYSVIRVRIPLSSLVIGSSPGLGGTIEADVLVGEDGLARGIRFDEKDTLLVSTVSR